MYHSNENKMNLAFLEGCIDSQKRIIEINSKGGLHKVCPEKEIEDKAYLKGLEDALSIMRGER